MLENDGVFHVRNIGYISKTAYYKGFSKERMNATQSERCIRAFGILMADNCAANSELTRRNCQFILSDYKAQ